MRDPRQAFYVSSLSLQLETSFLDKVNKYGDISAVSAHQEKSCLEILYSKGLGSNLDKLEEAFLRPESDLESDLL